MESWKWLKDKCLEILGLETNQICVAALIDRKHNRQDLDLVLNMMEQRHVEEILKIPVCVGVEMCLFGF